MLFEENFPRTDGPAHEKESEFDFAQRSSKPVYIEICQRMNEWYDEYPSDRKNLKKDLKADPQTSQAARFELQCHRILKRAGLSLEVEPDLPNAKGKIDFFAWPPDAKDEGFYVEATVGGYRKGPLTQNSNELKAVKRIVEGIERLPNLHSDIWLETNGHLKENLPKRHVPDIVEKFRELLDGCTAEQVRLLDLDWRLGDIRTRPIRPLEEENWTIEGHLSPSMDPSGKKKVWGPSRSAVGGASQYLYASLKRKAKDWRSRDLGNRPLIVAVNVCNLEFFWDTRNGDVENIHIRDALFENPDHPEPNERFRREFRCLNAVIVFDRIICGVERGKRVRMFRNGDAEIPESLRFMLDEQRYEDLIGI